MEDARLPAEITLDTMYFKGLLREMLMEYWQKVCHVSNTYQLTGKDIANLPSSIKLLMKHLEDALGHAIVHDWTLEIQDDYNAGRRS